jgi:hypothetical protein
MTKLRRFWKALESPYGLSGVPAELKLRLGSEFEPAAAMMRPLPARSETYPCAAPGGEGCPRRVVVNPDGRITAACGCSPKECDAIAIRPEDIVVHEFDAKRLCGLLADRLSLGGASEAVAGNGSAWSVGSASMDTGGKQVFLLPGGTPGNVANGLSHLLASFRTSWTAFAPTLRCFSAAQREMVTQHGSSLLALEDLVAVDENGNLTMISNPFAPEPSIHRQFEENIFRREQDVWLLSFGGRTVRLLHLTGFDYIADLLRRPGAEIETLVLARRTECAPGVIASAGIDVADDKALRDVRRALVERRLELAGLKENDWPRRGALQTDISKLEAYVSQAEGKHARSRKTAGSVQRARSAVAHAVARAIERIERDHQALAEHLRDSIRTGNTFLYLPSKSIEWRF